MRASKPTTAVALPALLLAVLALGGGTAQGAAFPGGNGRIAYASSQSGSWDIYSMNANGGGRKQLTSGPGNDTQPSFSADGARIVFASDRAGNYDIYVMNADGSDQTRIVSEGGVEETPTFSPDGTRIAFVRTRQANKDIFTVGLSGEGLAPVTSNRADDRQPSFSPNGQRIAFASRRDGRFDVYTMGSGGGGGATKLTDKPVSQMPAFSPNGQRIAFARGGSIFTMSANGGSEVRLTHEPGAQLWPTWQPLPGGGGGGVGGGGASGERLRIGRPILNRAKGTAKLPVTVPAAGTLKLKGKGIKPLTRSVAGATTVKLPVKPKAGALKALAQKGKAKVKALVTYARRGSGKETGAKSFSLRRNRG